GNTNEVNVEKPKSVNESVVSTPNINKGKVIIKDWNSDDEDDVSKVSHVKTNETQTAKTQVDKIGQTSKKAGIRFKKIKACFVCKSTDHLIKDCNFYDKKSPEPKLENVVNTGVLTRTGLINLVRLNEKRAVQTINTARVKNMTTAGTRAVVNTSKGKMNNDLKKSRWVWRPKGNYMDHESKEKGSFILKKFEYGNPEICLQDHAVVDSGCSSHMTGNKAYLSDYEDYNGGFMAFGSDPKGGKIIGTQEHYVVGSSEKDKEPTQEYILLPLHPHRPRILVEDVAQAAQEKPSENSPKDNDVQDSEDFERMIAQEIAAKAIDDATRQVFEEEKKRAAQATSINKLKTSRTSVSTSNSPLVSAANTPYASVASTPTGANTV
ncbi:hypothetical protein Tco_1527319, partial [Tanacetum coccineum]